MRVPPRHLTAAVTVAVLLGCSCTSAPRGAPSAPDAARESALPGAAPQQNPFGLARRPVAGLRVATFEEAIALPADDLDIGRAVLLLAREERPGLDVPTYMAELDALADDLRSFMVAHPEMPRRDSFATFLFGRFTADASDPLGHNPDNLYIDRVLDRRAGYCVSLSLLGLAMAQRLDLPVQGMRAPFHYWLRLDGRNIETTDGGSERSDADYRRAAGVSAESASYFRPVSPRCALADLLSNHGALAYRSGNLARARHSLDLAIAIDESLPFAWHNRAVVRAAAGDAGGARADLDRTLALDPAATWSLRKRAQLRLAAGDREGAATDLQRALQLE